MVKVDPAATPRLDAMVDSYVKSVIDLDPKSQAFSDKADAIHTLGDRAIRQATSGSNRMLAPPLRATGTGSSESKAPGEKSLVDLRQTIEDHDAEHRRLPARKNRFRLHL